MKVVTLYGRGHTTFIYVSIKATKGPWDLPVTMVAIEAMHVKNVNQVNYGFGG